MLLPIVHPVPIPEFPTIHEILKAETQNVWWVENTRSEWTVVEDCWFNSSVSAVDWVPLEGSLRHDWLQSHTESPLVGMDLDWRDNGFCVRIQGLPTDVSDAMVDWWAWLEIWKPTRPLYSKDPPSLSDLHREHFTPQREKPRGFGRTSPRVQWKRFWRGVTHKQVQFGPEQLDISPMWNPMPQSNANRTARSVASNNQCLTTNTTIFPEMAISIDYEPVGTLDATSMRYLSMNLGRGVRSRLSQELRETQGLLYTIGATYHGSFIRVEFSASEAVLSDVLIYVDSVMNDLAIQPVTADEWMTARAQYTKDIYRTLENPALLTRTLGYYQQSSTWEEGVLRRLNKDYPEDLDWRLYPVRWYVTGDTTWLEGTHLETECLQP